VRFKAKSIAALATILDGLPGKMRVEVDPGIGVSAKTVGELRKLTTWPGNLAIITPRERDPESVVRVSKANVASRVSPKP
jgi:tRNA A37 threonylcarbamoyladenosine synthetase subunit TsaC/SUA5/YrdC